MPRNKRPVEKDDWQKIQQFTLRPEQKAYELLRPVVLFNETVADWAQEPGTAERTMYRRAEQFEERGMANLFLKDPVARSEDKSPSLPPAMRQLIVDRKLRPATPVIWINMAICAFTIS
jgi:putative transposase